MKQEIFCEDCNFRIENVDAPCPNCGSIRKHLHIKFTEEIRVLEGLKIKEKREGEPGYAFEAISRDKISKGTKVLAKEELIIDRTDKTKTIKQHRVKEFIDGKWVSVHSEEEEFKARRRKNVK